MKFKIKRSNARTIEEWISLYEQKTGDKMYIPEGFVLNYLPDRGFALLKADLDTGIMIIYHLCGDSKFWRDVAELIAKNSNLKCISSIATRSIRPYMRFWHWDIVKEFDIDNQKKFICKDEQGRKVVITHKGFDDKSNTPTYFVTQYLNEKVVDAGGKNAI